jgi:hypothetical protein
VIPERLREVGEGLGIKSRRTKEVVRGLEVGGGALVLGKLQQTLPLLLGGLLLGFQGVQLVQTIETLFNHFLLLTIKGFFLFV